MPSENYIGKPKLWDHGDQSAGGKFGADHICMPLMRSPTNQETLELFPMHPTGILQEKTPCESPENSNVTCTATPSSSSDTTMCFNEQEAAADQRFFDFFSGNIGAQ